MQLAAEKMALKNLRTRCLPDALRVCDSSSPFAQICTTFPDTGAYKKAILCVFFLSSLHLAPCSGTTQICFSCSSTYVPLRHSLEVLKLLKKKDTLLNVPAVERRMHGSPYGTLFIKEKDDHLSKNTGGNTREIQRPLQWGLNSTLSEDSNYRESGLRSRDDLDVFLPLTGEKSSSQQGKSRAPNSSSPGLETKVGPISPDSQIGRLLSSDDRSSTNSENDAREDSSAGTAGIPACRGYGLERLKNHIHLDSNKSSERRHLQPSTRTSSASSLLSSAHPGVSVLGRVGQNAEINGEYRLVGTDEEKGFLFKKVTPPLSGATPLYLFSSGHAPLRLSGHTRQQQQHRDHSLYWAIGEVPYANEKIRAFAFSDAASPDLINGTWSVFEQQNNETILVPDKFVIVVLVGCNNGALDGNESGMDCGGACETKCENMRYCQLPRTLPTGYALGGCPLHGLLQHGEGCTYKCPLGWKESGALGRVCYDGTLLEIRRGPGCEEAFTPTASDAKQCQFLLLDGAPPEEGRNQAQASRGVAHEAKGADASEEEVREGRRGTLLAEQGRAQERTDARSLRFQQDTYAGRAEQAGGLVASSFRSEEREGSRRATGEQSKNQSMNEWGGRRWSAGEVEIWKERGKRHGGGGGGGRNEEWKSVALLVSAGSSATAGIGATTDKTNERGRRLGDRLQAAGGPSAAEADAATRSPGADALLGGPAAADLQVTESGTYATRGDAQDSEGGEAHGGYTKSRQAQPHLCNGLYIMHAVRGASGQRAVFWQRDAEGVLIQLYWEDGYWVCASFDKDVEYGYIWDPFPSKLVSVPSTPLLGSKGVWARAGTTTITESATSLHCVDPLRSLPEHTCVAVYFSHWKNPALQGYFFSVLPRSPDGRPRYINEKQLLLHWTPLGYWVAGDVEDQTAALALTFSPSSIPPLTGWRSWNAEARRWETEEDAQVQCVVADDRVLPPHETTAGTAAGGAGAEARGNPSPYIPQKRGAYADTSENLNMRNSHHGFPAQIRDVTRTVIRSEDGSGPLIEALLHIEPILGTASGPTSVSLQQALPVAAGTLPAAATDASSSAEEKLSASEVGGDSCSHLLLEGGRSYGEVCNGVWSIPKRQQQQEQQRLKGGDEYMYKLSLDSRVLYLYRAEGQWRCTADGATLLGYSDAEETLASLSRAGNALTSNKRVRGNWLDGRRYIRGIWALTCIPKPTPPPQCDELSVTNFVDAAAVFNGKWTRSDTGDQQHYTKSLPGASTPPPLQLLHQQRAKTLLHLFYHPLSLWVIGSSPPSGSDALPKFFAYAMKSHSSAPPSGLWTVFDGGLNRAVLHLVDVECISKVASRLA